MELKIYQQNALNAFTHWLEALEEARNSSEKAIEALKSIGVEIPNDLRNYPQRAWEVLQQSDSDVPTASDYVTRTDDAKRPIPHVCFKVPTGGGKTLLAAAALERLPSAARADLMDRAHKGDLRTNQKGFAGQRTSLP